MMATSRSALSSLVLPGAILAALLAAPSIARAQDADSDGVADAADAFPCDGTRAAVSYFPSASESALLAFEDQWPGSTDLDFNDVALRAHYRLERNAAGNVVQLFAVIDPVAQGGDFSNGLGLVLPTSRTGVTARRRVNGGAWQTITPETTDDDATLVLSTNVRELFGNATGRINSLPAVARVAGQRLELEVTFSTAAPISTAAAPFDLFIFRSGDFGHQIHLPQYLGTQAMNRGLFNTQQDASAGARRFVHLSGVPAALLLSTTTLYPLEGVAISALFPDITLFASSGGEQNTSFYQANRAVAGQGHDVAMLALPAVAAPSTSCVSSVATTSLLVHLDASNPASYPGTGTTWFDLSGSGRNFTLINGPTFNSSGGFFSFDGGNDYARSSAALNLSSYTQVTVEVFARSAALANGILFEHTSNWNSVPGGFGLSVHSDGFVTLANQHHTNQNSTVVRNFNATVGTGWTQHVQTFSRVSDATGRLAFVNGAQVSFVAANGWGTSTSAFAPSFANDFLYLASRAGSVAFFGGQIGVVRVYGTKLSDAQVSQNFQATRARFGI
jgi:LruC domain-containing protein